MVLKRILVWTAVAVLALPGLAVACPVCFGKEGSAEVEGARWAILFLLGVTGTVLSGVVAFVLYVRKRTKMTLDGNVEIPSSN